MRVSPLRAAIQDKQFAPAYFLYGEDEFLKEEGLRQLIAAAVDPGTRDFNLDQRKGAELDAESLGSLLSTPPMMAERRVVAVRDVSGLRKDARAALEKYLRSPARDLLVVLTAPADARPDATLADLAVAVDCAPLTGAQVPKWIVARADKLGTTITPGAVTLLQDAVGADLSQLAIELDKLVAYCSGRAIDEDAVAKVVGVRREETPGQLLDAVAMRNSAMALSLIPGVLQQPKTSAVQIVMALTTQTIALAVMVTRGIPAGRLNSEYYGLLKSGSSNFTGRSWGEAVAAWTRAHGKWTRADLDHALGALLQADLCLKESRVSSDAQILATTILSMCAGASSRSAA
ncbi:MAG TPA: DNA polymerase III subunit delta [Gemmatimonadaceae bacterium]|nr:DNA polymerase III subunit delta [Gemmatimonadaceae bacterium]